MKQNAYFSAYSQLYMMERVILDKWHYWLTPPFTYWNARDDNHILYKLINKGILEYKVKL